MTRRYHRPRLYENAYTSNQVNRAAAIIRNRAVLLVLPRVPLTGDIIVGL